MNKREEILANGKISHVLLKLALPAIIAMLVNALYNIVDTIFIGRGIGALGIAGVAIQLPLQMLVLSSALLIGIGSGSLLSVSLGKGEHEKVNYIACNSFLCISIIGIIFSVFGYIFTPHIVRFLGATENIFPYARDYARIIFIGSLYFPFCVSTNNLIRCEGNSKEAMISMTIGFLLNVILDYMCIFVLNLGIKGAAIATILSKFGSFTYILLYLNSNKTSIEIKAKYFYPQKDILKEILSIGFSAFAVQLCGGIVTIILNYSLNYYGGDLAIATFGIVYKITLFLFMPLHGMIQGMQPLVGYNYGSNNIPRVKTTIKLTLIFTTLFTLFGMLILQLFPSEIIGMFNRDTLLLSKGIFTLKIVIIMTPFVAIQMTGLGVFQALGKALTSFFLSILRQVLLFIPLLLFLPNVRGIGILGIWLAFPISDLFSALITTMILKNQLNKILKI